MDSLRNRIDLTNIPYTERGSRLLLFQNYYQFSVRLAERWTKWEYEVGHYRQRPPIITGLTFLNNDEQAIYDMEVETYPYLVRLHTSLGILEWTFSDVETLLLKLPSGTLGLEFVVNANKGRTDSRGGTMHGKRNIAYTTNATILNNTMETLNPEELRVKIEIQANAGDAFLLNITPRLAFNRAIPDVASVQQRVQATWQAWFDATPPVLDEYRTQYEYAWWIMRAGLVNTRYYFTRESLFPSKVHYVGVWHWDQVFHALAYRHVDTQLAEDQIRIILDHQQDDGMLPDAIHDEGLVNRLTKPVEAEVTKPPIMAWGVLELFKTSRHKDFLYEVYEPLVRWHRWWIDNRRHENGLCEYHHPFSSGLDDSPLWDQGMPVIAPDLNTYLILQCDSLAQIAKLIGRESDIPYYQELSEVLLKQMLHQLWDEQAGVFWALHNEARVPTLTLFNLLPLLTGKLPAAMTQRIVHNLTDPNLFWTPYPLSTVAISDPAFDPLQMWRGPVWINSNYFFIQALERNNFMAEAAELHHKTLALVMQHADIYEYYHPMTGERPPKAAPMFGWSAALFIELAIAASRRAT